MQRASAYTTAEVAFLLREPIKAVKKALDEGPVEAKLVHKRGARPVREIPWRTSSICSPSGRCGKS